jgi:nicotinate-nucleotide adenylyltransferase
MRRGNQRDILRNAMKARIGVFGGTFDPPHLGHLILAAEAQAQLNLSRLLWVLTPAPPHKEGTEITALQHRIDMVRLAIHDNADFELSTVDMERPGPQYSVDTLRLLHLKYPGDKIALIIGGDSLRDLPTWHDPSAVVGEADMLGVMRRPGADIDFSGLERLVPGVAAKVHFVDAPLLEIASHEIRERARSGRPFRYYVPESVHAYILHNRLYQDA